MNASSARRTNGASGIRLDVEGDAGQAGIRATGTTRTVIVPRFATGDLEIVLRTASLVLNETKSLSAVAGIWQSRPGLSRVHIEPVLLGQDGISRARDCKHDHNLSDVTGVRVPAKLKGHSCIGETRYLGSRLTIHAGEAPEPFLTDAQCAEIHSAAKAVC